MHLIVALMGFIVAFYLALVLLELIVGATVYCVFVVCAVVTWPIMAALEARETIRTFRRNRAMERGERAAREGFAVKQQTGKVKTV